MKIEICIAKNTFSWNSKSRDVVSCFFSLVDVVLVRLFVVKLLSIGYKSPLSNPKRTDAKVRFAASNCGDQAIQTNQSLQDEKP